jgi:hypothetical protein
MIFRNIKFAISNVMLICLCLAALEVDAQAIIRYARWTSSTNTFTVPQNAIADDISSDHGMRVAGAAATRFHKGADFRPLGDQNVVLVAHQGGKVMSIKGSGLRKIFISYGAVNQANEWVEDHKLAYLHIFDNTDNTKSGFKMASVFSPIDGEQIPVIIDQVNSIAYCARAGLTVAGTLGTTNLIVAGAPFAPMGNSGVVYPYHAHISLLENNETNDLSCDNSNEPINHKITVDDNLANIRLRLRNRNKTVAAQPGTVNCEENPNRGVWQSFEPTYNDETRNIIEAELHMEAAAQVTGHADRYQNGYMNDEEVEVELRNKSCSEPWYVARGRNDNTRVISNAPGGKQITPARICAQQLYGGLAHNLAGIIPYAYATDIGFHPHDYYIFPDFYHRMHKDHKFGGAVRLAQYP